MTLMSTLTAAALLLAAPFIHRRWRQHRAAKRLVITTPHGISESRFVPIGGIEQWVSLRGDDCRNPALLIVHGGPGSSYEMFAPIMRLWEEHFTIVQWDQRGAGRTFGRNGAGGSGEVSVARLTADGIEVAEWVREHLGNDRLILVGSSFGSVIALHMTQQRPDLFSAYVGTDQNVSMTGDLRPTLDRLREMGKHKAIAKLEKIGADPARWDGVLLAPAQSSVCGHQCLAFRYPSENALLYFPGRKGCAYRATAGRRLLRRCPSAA